MNDATPTMTLSPQAGLLLTKITATPDLETALWRVLHDYTGLKTQQLRQQIAALEAKWGMTFDEFSRRCEHGTLGQDPYAYDVESDYWDWEKAVTLLHHSPAFKRLVERGLAEVQQGQTRPVQDLLDELPD